MTTETYTSNEISKQYSISYYLPITKSSCQGCRSLMNKHLHCSSVEQDAGNEGHHWNARQNTAMQSMVLEVWVPATTVTG